MGLKKEKETGRTVEKSQKMHENYINGCNMKRNVIYSTGLRTYGARRSRMRLGRMNKMADYKKMYMILCGAVDEVIDPLEQIPMARASAQVLREALLQAERVYIDTSVYAMASTQPQVVELRNDQRTEPENHGE